MTLAKRRVEREKPVLTNTSFAIPTRRRALEYHIIGYPGASVGKLGQFQSRLKTTAIIWFLRRMDSLKTDRRQQQYGFRGEWTV